MTGVGSARAAGVDKAANGSTSGGAFALLGAGAGGGMNAGTAAVAKDGVVKVLPQSGHFITWPAN